jgi:hypothetical protein
MIVAIYDLTETKTNIYKMNNTEQKLLITIEKAKIFDFSFDKNNKILFAALSTGFLSLIDLTTY